MEIVAAGTFFVVLFALWAILPARLMKNRK